MRLSLTRPLVNFSPISSVKIAAKSGLVRDVNYQNILTKSPRRCSSHMQWQGVMNWEILEQQIEFHVRRWQQWCRQQSGERLLDGKGAPYAEASLFGIPPREWWKLFIGGSGRMPGIREGSLNGLKPLAWVPAQVTCSRCNVGSHSYKPAVHKVSN